MFAYVALREIQKYTAIYRFPSFRGISFLLQVKTKKLSITVYYSEKWPSKDYPEIVCICDTKRHRYIAIYRFSSFHGTPFLLQAKTRQPSITTYSTFSSPWKLIPEEMHYLTLIPRSISLQSGRRHIFHILRVSGWKETHYLKPEFLFPSAITQSTGKRGRTIDKRAREKPK